MIAIWDQRLSVGDATLDAEHRQLINLLNEIDVALTVRAPREVIERALVTLADSIERHLLIGGVRSGEHVALISKARRLLEDWRQGLSLSLDRRVLMNLAQRWIAHMGRAERPYASAVNIQQQRLAG